MITYLMISLRGRLQVKGAALEMVNLSVLNEQNRADISLITFSSSSLMLFSQEFYVFNQGFLGSEEDEGFFEDLLAQLFATPALEAPLEREWHRIFSFYHSLSSTQR